MTMLECPNCREKRDLMYKANIHGIREQYICKVCNNYYVFHEGIELAHHNTADAKALNFYFKT